MRTLHPNTRAERYLKELQRAARSLPADSRDDLVSQITEHLLGVIPPEMSDEEVLDLLRRLGEPEELVAEQRARLGLPTRPFGSRELWTVILLLLGGFLAGIGWLVGAWMLWWSKAWTNRQKAIGTLVIPGGLATSAALLQRLIAKGGSQSALTSAVAVALALLLLLAPLASAIFLARCAVAPPRRAA